MDFFSTFELIIISAFLGGTSAGVLGHFIIGMRMPFLAVATAHAALAGAVFSEFVGISHSIGGFAGGMLSAGLFALFIRKGTLDINNALGTFFSFTMGLAFLGIGLVEGPKSSALGLLWGSLLFVTPRQLLVMSIVSCCFFMFILLFSKQLKLLLFSRDLADLLLPFGGVFVLLLIFAAGVVTVNLEAVGGLLLYSLICNPAIAAAGISQNYRTMLLLSGVFGSASALCGFLIAYLLDLPVGACIVLTSSAVVGIAKLYSKLQKR